MNEDSADQLGGKETVEQLQKAFSELIDNAHQLAGQAFGETGNRFLAPGRHNQEAASELADRFMVDFDRLYRQVPDGHHLDVGLTPLAWYKAKGDRTLNLLSRKEMSPDGPRYYLKVGRYAEQANLKPNESRLNLSPIGTNDPKNPSAKVEGIMVSDKGYQRTGIFFYPEDITVIKIVANPQNNPSL